MSLIKFLPARLFFLFSFRHPPQPPPPLSFPFFSFSPGSFILFFFLFWCKNTGKLFFPPIQRMTSGIVAFFPYINMPMR